MNAYFYKFAKKINSTKRPSSSDSYTTKQVVLKENTTLMNPIFRLTGVDWEWSLAYWNGYYYFIDDIVARNNNIYEVHCTMDVLGSYRGEIGSMTTFIERSASNYDDMVVDSLLSSTQDLVNKSSATTSIGFSTAGTYFITVAGVTGTNTYVFPTARAASIFYSGTTFAALSGGQLTFQDMIDNALLMTVDVASHSTPIMWMPFNYNDAGIPVAGASVGFFKFTPQQLAFNIARTTTLENTFTLNVPTNIYSDFRKHHPAFSKYSLYLPAIGLVEVNTLDASEDDLKVDVFADAYTGAISYRVYHSAGGEVATFNGQIGVQIPCGADSVDIAGLITNTVGGVVSATSGNVGGALGSIVAVADGIISPQTCMSGGNGNRSVIENMTDIILTCENLGSKSFPTNQAGRPYYTNNQISNLSGFVKCGNASFDSACLEPIKEQINNYLNSGFYYE